MMGQRGRSQGRPKGSIVWLPNLSSPNSPLGLHAPSELYASLQESRCSPGSQGRLALMRRVCGVASGELEVCTLKETPLIEALGLKYQERTSENQLMMKKMKSCILFQLTFVFVKRMVPIILFA